MSTYTDRRQRADARSHRRFPTYGPVDALLGLVLFYHVLGRATPTIVDVLTDAVPAISSSSVRLGLALFVWFVVAVTVVDQLRRQLAALGAGGDEPGEGFLARFAPTEAGALGSLVLVVVFGLVAAWTFDAAIETAVSLIRVVATLDVGAFVPREFVVMVVFFVSFGVASRALDRLVVGGVRTLLVEFGFGKGRL